MRRIDGEGSALSTDVLIIGGGAIGSAAAYFLARAEAAPSVVVVEPDPTYAFAATPKASGGIRHLFSRPENIGMSQFSADFYRCFPSHVSVDGEAPDIAFKEQGYLFLVDGNGVDTLRRNWDLQRSMGVAVDLLDPAALARRFPSLNVQGIGAAAYSPRDGWLDPNAALQGFRRKARSLGVEFLKDRVVGIRCERGSVREVELASGRSLQPRFVVNAAGTWSAEICALIGMRLPVEPMRRFDHFFECPVRIEPLPFIKDLAGIGFRPEGTGYCGGLVDFSEPGGHNWDVDHSYFQDVVWPALAHRIPVFETLKLRASWVGHYDRNNLDGNMILGNWPGVADNFYVASGFSGHGLMHAPAVGRALSELILTGAYRTLDLGRMDYTRVLDDRPYAELGIR